MPEPTMQHNRWLTIALVAVATLLAIHIVGENTEGVRADVTADRVYTLSPGTLAILERMQQEGAQPVSARLYFSATAGKTLPSFIKDFITYERYLEALLRQYERAARGRMEVEVIDPLPDGDDAQDALDYGLEGKPVNPDGDPFFFGLVLETRAGSRQTIEFLWPEQQESVEYEITKRIHSLLWPAKQRLAIISGLEVMGSAANPFLAQMLAAQGKQPQERWLIMQLLEEQYEIEVLGPEITELSREEHDLVAVIHPKELPDETLRTLDRWVGAGGNMLVLIDPYAIEDQPPPNPREPWTAWQYPRSSDLAPLLAAWGIDSSAERVAADLDLAVRRSFNPLGPTESVVVDLGLDETALSAQPSAQHPILQGVGRLRLFMAGALAAPSPPAGVTVTPLLTTTAHGSTLEIRPGLGMDGLFYSDLGNPAKLRDALEPGQGGPVMIGCLIQGRLPTAFPSTAPAAPPEGEAPAAAEGAALDEDGDAAPAADLPAPAGEDATADAPHGERQEATVLVLADVDLIADPVAFQRNMLGVTLFANDNAKLLLNAVDYLLGSQDLMRVRAKAAVERPFGLLDDIEAAAEKNTLERERQIRAEIETFQEELRQKQTEITAREAALFEKKVQDEVDRLNERILEGNRELREIRKGRRAALEREEGRVRLAVLGWMPALVLGLGIVMSLRRRRRQRRGGRPV